MKSQVAAEAVKTMNPSINITAYTEPVSEETENIYNDRFFEQLDGVINALDNIKARQYIYKMQH
jgi:molybdopterin/thiamine biosynthesis adenylyltransferase